MVTCLSSTIVGSASERVWSQAQTITFPNSDKLMIVIQLRSAQGVDSIDLSKIGRDILVGFEQRAMTNIETDELQDMLTTFLANLVEGVEIDLLLGHVRQYALNLLGHGNICAYLQRDHRLALLGENWQHTTFITGHIRPLDVLFFTTKQVVVDIGLSRITSLLASDSPAESLTPVVHAQEDTSGMAAIIGQICAPEQQKTVGWWRKWLHRDTSIKLFSREPRRINLLVGGALLFLLVLMIGIGMVKRTALLAEREYSALDRSVTQKIEEILSIGDLNPERARSLLSGAKEDISTYLATKPKSAYISKVQQLSGRIDLTEEQAFKKNTVQLSTIVELPILADGLTATKMKSDGKDNLLFLDTHTPRLVQMNLTDRSRVIIASDADANLVDIGTFETHAYGLSASGVVRIAIKKQEIKQVIEADEFWKEPTSIGLFAGNIYVFDKGQGEVWKYPTLGDTYGGRRRWFAAGITPDLSNVVDMKVMGDIWFLTSTGKLLRYSRGAPVAFSMDGFPSQGEEKRLQDPVAVYPTESLIYVLERGASRVVVFGDDGSYKAQYVNSDFGKASDLVIQDQTGYVLVDNTVKSFGL